MNEKEEVLLGVAIISGFVFLVSTLALLLQSSLPKQMCYPWNWIPYLFIIIASLGMFVGGVVHYLTVMYVNRKREDRYRKLREKSLLNCLPDEEKVVVRVLIDGPKFQSEITRETGLSKVKVHRIVKRLESRGVVSVERVGKTNIIRLILE